MPSDPFVHVIDDDKAVRQSITFLLSANEIPARGYDSACSFLDGVGKDLSGCILCDVRMPDMDGIELLKTLRARGLSIPVVVMTGHADVAMAVEAMKAGALDFLEKPFEDWVLLEALRQGLARGQAEGQRTRRRLAIDERLARLTPRERQILELIASGKQNKIIAHELGISPRTVEVHRANLIEKIEARSTSDLIAIFLESAQS